MKKRLFVVGMILPVVMTACNLLSQEMLDEERTGVLTLKMSRFSYDVPFTKAYALPDTNAFILTIKDSAGELCFQGSYGDRPEAILLKEGIYEVSVVSGDIASPGFDNPQWGDTRNVDIVADKVVPICFECTQINCGVKIEFGSKYLSEFAACPLTISQGVAKVEYDTQESRYAYFAPGETLFSILEQSAETPIFTRILKAGVNLVISLDASSNQGSPVFSVRVDTQAKTERESIITDGSFFEENGLSARTAYSVEEALKHEGDTVWVWGFVVGGDCSDTDVNFFTEPIASTTHFALASSIDALQRSDCMAVELSKAAMRTALNLVDNPSLKYKKIWVKGKIANYMGSHLGVKSIIEYQLE